MVLYSYSKSTWGMDHVNYSYEKFEDAKQYLRFRKSKKDKQYNSKRKTTKIQNIHRNSKEFPTPLLAPIVLLIIQICDKS